MELFDHKPAANDEPRRLATLVDGREVDSGSEEWRRECEARYVVAMPTQARKDYLSVVEKKRGAIYVLTLTELMRRVRLSMEARRVSDMPSLNARRRYLNEVEYLRGPDGRRALEEEIKRVWRPKAA